MPVDPAVDGASEEEFPRWCHILSQKTRHIRVGVSASEDQEEEGRNAIQRVSRADKSIFSCERSLEWMSPGIMTFYDPCPAIGDALCLEAAELQRDVWLELHDHVGTGGKACQIFVVLSHHAVAGTRIGGVDDLVLVCCIAGCKETLAGEKLRFYFVVLA